MNRLFPLTFLFLPFFGFAQNYGLCTQVVASTGGSGAQGAYQVSWTVGEVVVTTVMSANNKLTQGFHQSDICSVVSTSNLDLISLGMEVFPNPASSFLTIRYDDTEKLSLEVEAFDLLGSQVLQPQALQEPSGFEIDVSNWQPGIYFLRIRNIGNNATTTIRVVRL
jgi:hypothetical protein